jgi:copper(I)-binding protein
MRLRALAAVLTATFLAGPAFTHEFKAGDLLIEHPWARATVPNAKVAGGYLTIVNKGSAADKLIAVTADLGTKVELHEMALKDGVMSMRAVEGGVEIAPGATLSLEPGGHGAGYHIMFLGIDRQLKEGEKFNGSLTFEKAGVVPVEFKVEPMGFKAEDHSAHGG